MLELTVYGTGGVLPPIDELYELTGNENITAEGDDAPRAFVVIWDDVRVTLRLMDASATAQALNDARQFAERYLGERDDNKARKNLRRVALADTVIQITIDPAADPADKARNLVLGVLAWYADSFFMGDGALYNEQAKRFLGDDDARPRFFVEQVVEESAEATARKSRSLMVLRREKVPAIEHLPVIMDSIQTTPPTVLQIAERMVALVCIADRAEGETTANYEQRVEDLGVRHAVTTDEWDYAHTDAPIEQDTIKFSQRLEAAWVLAWAIGRIDTLKRPDDFCDVDVLHALAAQPISTLDKRVQLRPISAILDAADLHYRYHWAVNDAELYGTRLPARLVPAVVYERHYALNWLLTGAPWDSLNTDT